MESATLQHHGFEDILGKPERYADPRAEICANDRCSHSRGKHPDDGWCDADDRNDMHAQCQFRAFEPARTDEIIWLNLAPDGLNTCQYHARKQCANCGGAAFYLKLNWQYGETHHQPFFVNCNPELIGLPVKSHHADTAIASNFVGIQKIV